MNNKNEFDTDKKVCKIALILIISWIIIMINPVLFPVLIIIFSIIKLIFYLALITVVNDKDTNNGKDGYYAQYGTSFGANADKHKKYLEEKVANEIMRKEGK